MSSMDECRECKDAAGAVASWKVPVLVDHVWVTVRMVGIMGSLGVLTVLAGDGVTRGDEHSPWWQLVAKVFLVFGSTELCFAAIAAVVYVVKLLMFNVFRKDRGIYMFLDNGKQLHEHLALPVATPSAATPVFIGIGVGWLWRRTVCHSAAWQNWEVVSALWPAEILIKDRRGCQLPWTHPVHVLKIIARHVNVMEIFTGADVRADMYEHLTDKLGIGVQATILTAIAGKDIQRSPQAKALRERLERLLESLAFSKNLSISWNEKRCNELLGRWKAKAERLLAEETRATEVEIRVAAKTSEAQLAPTTAAGKPSDTGGI